MDFVWFSKFDRTLRSDDLMKWRKTPLIIIQLNEDQSRTYRDFLELASVEDLKRLNQLILPAVLRLTRKRIYGLKGVILIESALWADMPQLDFVNNQVIFIELEEPERQKRLIERSQMSSLYEAVQLNSDQKKYYIKKAIQKSEFGQLISSNGCNCKDVLRILTSKII
jgi:dephospho-CoA kinase